MLNIFVVEDSAADLFWLEMVLKNAHIEYTIRVAHNGEAAREALLQASPTPDLVFLDLCLPVLNGLELLRDIPERVKRVVYVLTTSDAYRGAVAKELGIANDRYLVKPLTHDSLLTCIAASAS